MLAPTRSPQFTAVYSWKLMFHYYIYVNNQIVSEFATSRNFWVVKTFDSKIASSKGIAGARGAAVTVKCVDLRPILCGQAQE